MFTFWLGRLFFISCLYHLLQFISPLYADLLVDSASVDGRVYVWKITEGPDEEDKPQITGRIVIAIQITGEGESFHPRVCWHCHKQVCCSFMFVLFGVKLCF